MDQAKLSKALKPGTVLKSPLRDYTIVKALGAGGFGITYLVTGRVENAQVEFAIKEHFMSSLCSRSNTQDVAFSEPVRNQVLSALQDFIAEASRLNNADVRHNSLVGINEVFEANNTAYYVMEYIQGDSLRNFVRKNYPDGMDEDEAIELLTPVLDAINVMHFARITHLDIKPDNILLTNDYLTGKLRPVIIDFGLSKHYDEGGRPTSEIKVLGCSEGYSPLEQYVGIKEFSPTADVYALGATLFYMLTGRSPLKADEMNSRIIRESLVGKVRARVCEAICDAMNPQLRYRTQNVALFASDLGVALPTAPGVRVMPLDEPKPEPKSEPEPEVKPEPDPEVTPEGNQPGFGLKVEDVKPLSGNAVEAAAEKVEVRPQPQVAKPKQPVTPPKPKKVSVQPPKPNKVDLDQKPGASKKTGASLNPQPPKPGDTNPSVNSGPSVKPGASVPPVPPRPPKAEKPKPTAQKYDVKNGGVPKPAPANPGGNSGGVQGTPGSNRNVGGREDIFSDLRGKNGPKPGFCQQQKTPPSGGQKNFGDPSQPPAPPKQSTSPKPPVPPMNPMYAPPAPPADRTQTLGVRKKSEESGHKTGLIIGIIVMAVIFVAVLLFSVLYVLGDDEEVYEPNGDYGVIENTVR